ncbi:60S ribosomal protein L6 [Cucumispora dikerogammari]|nr:60S ribosomal protein L6 [Cucumispora dikerogammari]
MSTKETKSKITFVAPQSGYFPDEKIPQYIKKLQSKQVQIQRVPRTDLEYGNIVVILEGEFVSKRAIFLGSNKFEAVVIGPRCLNGVPLMKIDEKYLLKTSTVLKLNKMEIKETTFISEKDFSERINFQEPSELEVKLEEEILNEIKKIEFMKAYLSTDFDLKGLNKIEDMKF